MSTIIRFGVMSYDIDTKEGSKALMDALRGQASSVPMGVIDLLFLKVDGKGAVIKRKGRFDAP